LEDYNTAAPLDEYDNPIPGGGSTHVRLIKFQVVRHTPKGVWLSWFGCRSRFVLKGAHKRFACPTLAEAKESFLARKKRQIGIYEARIKTAKQAIELAEKERFGEYGLG
jgi:hypothetical protein